MLKKIFLKLIIILIIFLFPLISFAEESANVSLKCDKDNIKLGEELELEINLDGKKTAAYQVNIFFDEEKFDFISEVDNNMLVKNGIIKIVWYDEKGGLNAAEGNLKRLVFKAKEEGIGNFTINGEFYDENCNYILTNFNSLDIKVGDFPDENEYINESTNLETLAIENEILYPAFDNNINDYDIEISNNVSNLNILAIPEDENTSVLINGNENLIEGDNKITIKVKSQSGVERNININVHKRNDIEEAEYSAHKGDLKEELEEAYKIEKILSQNENFKNTIDTLDDNYENYMNKDFETTKNNNYEILILKVISMILLILSFFCFIIFLVKNKSDT